MCEMGWLRPNKLLPYILGCDHCGFATFDIKESKPMKAKVELSEQEVVEIIKKAMEQRFLVTKVNLEVGLEYEDRPAGGKYPKFKKAVVDIEI
jgi:hypothetical protein